MELLDAVVGLDLDSLISGSHAEWFDPPSPLAQIIENYKDHPFYLENRDQIQFELNHLELHKLDSFYVSCYENNGFFQGSNPGNSYISYLIGLTDKLPSGQLKTTGGSVPDIDVDFDQERRSEVFDYLKEKYNDGFAHIGTFGTTKGKGIFKSVCRIFEIPFETSNKLSKTIPDTPGISLEEALNESSDFRDYYNSSSEAKEIVDYAIKLEGCVSNYGVHACGVILSDDPVDDYIALFESKGDVVAQCDGETAEKVGLIKYDILGLKALSIISKTIGFVSASKDIDIDIKNIPLDDGPSYQLMAEGNLLGVFQLEGSSIAPYVPLCAPKTIKDISGILSLVRPGPLGLGLDKPYINACQTGEHYQFRFPKYQHIFKDTYGIGLYQEQYMILLQEMCGFDGVKSDVWRRAVGKKDMDLLATLKEDFIDGAVANGESRSSLEEFWEEMNEFGRYAFNASHSFSYSFISYQMAYLKANYPVEFYASCISCEDDPEKQSLYIQDARRNGIQIFPPDVNKSLEGFSVVEDSIFFGLNGIKGVGAAVFPKIANLKPFTSFGDFLARTYMAKGFNKKVYESLILSGACDSFGYKRSCMMRSFEKFISDFDPGKKRLVSDDHWKKMLDSQGEYFHDPLFSEFPYLSLLEHEYSLTGVYISGSPFDVIKKVVRSSYVSVSYASSIANQRGKVVDLLIKVCKVRKLRTKAGADMCILEAMDHESTPVSIAVFPNNYSSLKDFISEGNYYLCSTTARNDAKGIGFFANGLQDLSDKIEEVQSSVVDGSSSYEVSLIVDGFPGTARSKTIHAKLSDLEKGSDGVVNLVFRKDGYEYLIERFSTSLITIDVFRELSKIPDCYILKVK